MTGGTSGLGKVSALKAAWNGHQLILLARNREKSRALIDEFKRKNRSSCGNIDIFEGDLNSFESTHEVCKNIKAKYPRIDMLVHNAGIMSFKHNLSKNQIEETLHVNLIAPVFISHLLFDNLKQSDAAKIIFTSSGLHQGNINFDDLEFKHDFSTFKTYRQSKLGLILLSRLLAQTLEKYNIGIYCQHPGVVRTDLGKQAGWLSRIIFYLMGKSPEKGAQTLNYLIERPKSELKSGEYYVDKAIKASSKESYNLEVADKLLALIGKYIQNYSLSSSPFLSRT